ncbi:hypothetical protein JHK86_018293 [Glycine max]|nr:hypothetical protein JHK86_018293 [Glycine max]
MDVYPIAIKADGSSSDHGDSKSNETPSSGSSNSQITQVVFEKEKGELQVKVVKQILVAYRHHRQLPLHAQGLAASTLSPMFGGANFCLGHGDQHDELQPCPIQKFRRKGIHIVRASAGDEHAMAIDSNGFGYCGALGHGDEIDNTTPELLISLKNQLDVQVCTRKRKTFVLVNSGLVYGFGSMGFGSLRFLDRRVSDKVLKPRILDTMRAHHVSQISTGLYHTVVITSRG